MSNSKLKLGRNYEHKRAGRVLAFQALYSYEIEKKEVSELLSFESPETALTADGITYARFLLEGTLNNINLIDSLIKDKLVKWDFKRISMIDKAILRFAVFELINEDVPDVIIINEAVEIAKQFGNEESYKFINGILDAINKTKKKNIENSSENKN